MIKYFLIFLLVASPAFAKPKPTPRSTPRPSATPELVCRTKQKDLELRDWIDGVLNELHKAQADLIAAQKNNADVQAKLTASQKNATDLATQCASDHECAKSPLSCWYHRFMRHLLFGGIILVVVVVALLIFAPGVVSAIGSVLSLIGSVVSRALETIRNLFKKKPPTP